MIVILFMIHLVMAVMFLILGKIGKISAHAQLFVILLLLPFAGEAVYLIQMVLEKKNRLGSADDGVDRLRIQDEHLKQIRRFTDSNPGRVVPLEEAMILNSPKDRRRLMLKFLTGGGDTEVGVLQEARLSEDTEVSHYASTAMMKMQEKYENEIRDLEKGLGGSPTEAGLRLLWTACAKYIGSGLISGTVQTIYRKKMDKVLSGLLEKAPEDRAVFEAYLRNRISLGMTEGVGEKIHDALQQHPQDMSLIRLAVYYAQISHRPDEVDRLLRSVAENQIYLSAEDAEWYEFMTGAN